MGGYHRIVPQPHLHCTGVACQLQGHPAVTRYPESLKAHQGSVPRTMHFRRTRHATAGASTEHSKVEGRRPRSQERGGREQQLKVKED